jgi:hypothetical protein
MDTFAALALATDPASLKSLERKPEKKSAPLLSVDMYKRILGHSVYQTIITLIFHFLGAKILGFHHENEADLQKQHDKIVQTLVFNIFVFAQIFNSINSRRLDNKLNIFEGVLKNYYFMGITLLGALYFNGRYLLQGLTRCRRGRYPDPDCVRGWRRLPGNTHWRPRMGNRDRSWLCLYCSRCSFTLHPQRTYTQVLYQGQTDA